MFEFVDHEDWPPGFKEISPSFEIRDALAGSFRIIELSPNDKNTAKIRDTGIRCHKTQVTMSLECNPGNDERRGLKDVYTHRNIFGWHHHGIHPSWGHLFDGTVRGLYCVRFGEGPGKGLRRV